LEPSAKNNPFLFEIIICFIYLVVYQDKTDDQ
jgi:hypothetical protein